MMAGVSATVLIVIGGLLTATITATATYFVARRTASGRVSTSTAEVLWRESTKMRDELRDELTAARAEVASLRVEVATLEARLKKRGH